MTTPVPGPQGLQTMAARTTLTGAQPTCANCARVEESDTRLTLANLSRKYTDLADVVAGYMISDAELAPEPRNRNARTIADRIARIVGGFDTRPGDYPDCALIGHQYPNG